ncbi:FixJ family two-component response regulator [Cupriavidus metallidurans]|uniref:Two component transcriptional regulator, LuxR family (Receiver domain CheY-like) n=1 Tax=Cupriavidus metallidurans (strain ATCC 43123 / DSM 2839 / NBRC 102507 / CH34) TaxID=266264 RepID=Q1LCF7_CUPMC|nr:response regulator [Cupriavidus metallidurans]ABF12169.1 two component transcriptional regulator, LuxR family (receiver domain CheY-like) [Cupriavidus metallidurans CH34]AVA35714.1 DNA-binding response regulator [Cupriavidus metallidurans]MDE4921688.1 response regulator [Cupriavidus metallidurans]QGS32577.1 response regulator [Cupriavidus metallidurans]
MTSTCLEPAASAEYEPGTVLVLDDDAMVLDALGGLFRSLDMDVALFASEAELMAYPLPDTPCCLLLDVRLGGASGLDLQSRLGQSGVGMPIIFMTGYGDVAMTAAAMKAGAVDFLTKPILETSLIAAVSAALDRDRSRRRGMRRTDAIRRGFATLTPREAEVMGMAVSGLLNKQIAGEIGISEVTVKIHRGQAMRKMNARSFADLVLMGQELGLYRDAARRARQFADA